MDEEDEEAGAAEEEVYNFHGRKIPHLGSTADQQKPSLYVNLPTRMLP